MDKEQKPDTLHARAHALLRVLLIFSLASTLLHLIHNYVEIERYPGPEWLSPAITQVGILVGWPLFTVFGLLGYWLHSRRRYTAARGWLLAHSMSGLVTLGHFLSGVPDIPWYWFATIFTDAVAGPSFWVFVVWSSVAMGPRRPTPVELAMERRT